MCDSTNTARYSWEPLASPLPLIGKPADNAVSSLCRSKGGTCGACCWGKQVERKRLTSQLSRNRYVFERYVAGFLRPSSLRLLIHEIRASLGTHVVFAMLLRIPVLRKPFRNWFADRLVCTFVAFDADDSTAVGCLMHPSRHSGRDIRTQSAFRLLPGVECGRPTFFCKASMDLVNASDSSRAKTLDLSAGSDWFDYSSRVRHLCDS